MIISGSSREPHPKPGKIGQNPEPRDFIQHHLERRWSPEPISQVLRARFPDQAEMHVTHETIYQALYVQGRGELRRELTKALRTRRTLRRPHQQAVQQRPRMAKDMVMISERPSEAADRAIPGPWAGNQIIGKGQGSAIGTPVERSSRFVALVHLPDARPRPRRPCPDCLAAAGTTAALSRLGPGLVAGLGSLFGDPGHVDRTCSGRSGRRRTARLRTVRAHRRASGCRDGFQVGRADQVRSRRPRAHGRRPTTPTRRHRPHAAVAIQGPAPW